jgi:F-type H+-transporting ATPase subunit gamma
MTMQQTRQRREAVSTIHDIVNAMRAIAAGRIQGAQRALTAAARYEEVVLRGLASLLNGSGGLPAPTGRTTLLVVLTSEQPFCGTFNQNILALAERRWQELRQQNAVELVAVGVRGTRQLIAMGIRPDAALAAATSLVGLRDLVKRLAALVDHRYAAGQIGEVRVLYNRYRSVSEQIATEEVVLPLDPARLPGAADRRIAYHHYLPRPELLAGLIGEYAFIRLYRIAADSFASEQASRLTAMDGATHNSERMLQQLLDLERRERQDEITRDVLELIAARFSHERC